MTKDLHREEMVFFRLVDLSDEHLSLLKQTLKGVPLETKRRKETGMWVVAFALDERQNHDKLCEFIGSTGISAAQYGIWISLLTNRDNDGVHVPSHAVDLVRRIGGQIDFSFISGGDPFEEESRA